MNFQLKDVRKTTRVRVGDVIQHNNRKVLFKHWNDEKPVFNLLVYDEDIDDWTLQLESCVGIDNAKTWLKHL